MKLKTGDTVKIMAGKDKGKSGEITKILPIQQKVVVKGINVSKRHVKPREGIEGGIFPIDKPLPISSVALVDPTTKKPTRVGYKLLPNGKKVRVAKVSGAELDKPKKTTTDTKNKTKKSSNKK